VRPRSSGGERHRCGAGGRHHLDRRLSAHVRSGRRLFALVNTPNSRSRRHLFPRGCAGRLDPNEVRAHRATMPERGPEHDHGAGASPVGRSSFHGAQLPWSNLVRHAIDYGERWRGCRSLPGSFDLRERALAVWTTLRRNFFPGQIPRRGRLLKQEASARPWNSSRPGTFGAIWRPLGAASRRDLAQGRP